MSEIKVNKISPRTNCGTVQLGDSGDTGVPVTVNGDLKSNALNSTVYNCNNQEQWCKW